MPRVTLNHQDNLHELLNSLIVEHKQDIHAYSAGHLNESRLPKLEIPKQQARWVSSSSSKKNEKDAATTIPELPKRKLLRKEADMKDALLKFISGSDPRRQRLKPSDGLVSSSSLSSLDKENGFVAKDVEIKVGDKTAKAPFPDLDRSKRQRFPLASESVVSPRINNATPKHLMKATKKEQYQSMKDFKKDVLRTSDTLQRNILHTNQTIERLERKLKRALATVAENEVYRRLKIHGDIFNELSKSSPVFHDILTSIQTEYERYLSYLLDGHVDRYEILSHQIDQLSARHSIEGPLIRDEEIWIGDLEQRVRDQLKVNERLRAELMAEEAFAASAAAQDDIEPPTPELAEPKRVEPSEQIETLRKAIAERLYAISALRIRARQELVPVSVCNHLRQSLRETNVGRFPHKLSPPVLSVLCQISIQMSEIKKLTKRLEMYERSCHQLELEFQDAISVADASDRDIRRIWRRMLSIGAVISSNAYCGQTRVDDPLKYPDDDDESTKWNWYIA